MNIAAVWMYLSTLVGRVQARADERGQALVEYMLIIALVALAVILALHFLGGTAANTLNATGNCINNAPSSTAGCP